MNRATMLGAVEDLVSAAKSEEECVFFIPKRKEIDEEEIMHDEYALLGFYVTKHPLDSCSTRINDLTKIANLTQIDDGTTVIIGGIIAECKEITTKKGAKMCFLKLEDKTGRTEVVVFPRAYTANEHLFVKNNLIELSGKLEIDELDVNDEVVKEPKILLYKVKPLDKMAKVKKITCFLSDPKMFNEVKHTIELNPGDIPLEIVYQNFSFQVKTGFSQGTDALAKLKGTCITKEVTE